MPLSKSDIRPAGRALRAAGIRRHSERRAVLAACWSLLLLGGGLAPVTTDLLDVQIGSRLGGERALASMPLVALPPSLMAQVVTGGAMQVAPGVSPFVAQGPVQACPQCQLLAAQAASAPALSQTQTLGNIARGNVINVASVVNRSLMTPSQHAAGARAAIPQGMSHQVYATTGGARTSPLLFLNSQGRQERHQPVVIQQPARNGDTVTGPLAPAPVFETPWWNPAEGFKPEGAPSWMLGD